MEEEFEQKNPKVVAIDDTNSPGVPPSTSRATVAVLNTSVISQGVIACLITQRLSVFDFVAIDDISNDTTAVFFTALMNNWPSNPCGIPNFNAADVTTAGFPSGRVIFYLNITCQDSDKKHTISNFLDNCLTYKCRKV